MIPWPQFSSLFLSPPISNLFLFFTFFFILYSLINISLSLSLLKCRYCVRNYIPLLSSWVLSKRTLLCQKKIPISNYCFSLDLSLKGNPSRLVGYTYNHNISASPTLVFTHNILHRVFLERPFCPISIPFWVLNPNLFPTMNSKRFSPTSSTIKSRFTRRFLRALLKIYRQRTRTPSSPMEICQRYLKVKLAADVSMASAVGSRRAWSRAMLAKIRHGVRAGSTSSLTMRKRKIYHEKKSTKEVGIVGNAKMLRKLVPGGEAMDTCSLLDETFHYIKCLSTQVKVMTRIADQICSTWVELWYIVRFCVQMNMQPKRSYCLWRINSHPN